MAATGGGDAAGAWANVDGALATMVVAAVLGAMAVAAGGLVGAVTVAGGGAAGAGVGVNATT